MNTKKTILFFIFGLVLLLVLSCIELKLSTTETMQWNSLRLKFNALSGFISLVLLAVIIYYKKRVS